jgi:hypothetical protein
MPTPAGLVFSETMRGPFALGELDPARGAAAGRTARTVLTLRVTVTIPNLAAFAGDPSHSAHLGGHVTFGPLGERLSAVSGVVRLFAPRDEDSHAKVMYYGLRLAHGSRTVYLAGEKHVNGRSIFAMWPETTTLYTRLHDGPDDGAPVIGAGVLRLSPLDLLRTLPTMQPAPPRSVAALAKFGDFFVSELWGSYIARRRGTTNRGANARRV